VYQVVALEAEHLETPPREMEQRRTAHPSEAQHDRIERGQRLSSFSQWFGAASPSGQPTLGTSA
jgi:hypothetical protein